tara:strand:- start:11190 stop:11486 length:297 start_codon:yes stop_codon:yes gene_type:complete
MELLVFLLIAYGITNIMVFSTIFEKWRNFWVRVSPNFFGNLFTCMMCLPFWVGVLLSYFAFPISGRYLDSMLLGIFLDGCLTSGSVWLIHTLQEKLEK